MYTFSRVLSVRSPPLHSCVRHAVFFHSSRAARWPQSTPESSRDSVRRSETSSTSPKNKRPSMDRSTNSSPTSTPASESNQSLPPGWEDELNRHLTTFAQLPHRTFGFNQHMIINEEFKESLRQILWQFRAPIRYAFAYGSGVFPQNDGSMPPASLSPHPHPPEAVTKWQKGGGKIIDFIFGVSYTQHWHSLNLQQHRDHYSFLGSLGSAVVTRVQDKWGAGVYFNPYITVNGVMIKYGVVNLDVLSRDLQQWETLYLAGRLHKPVKILRDDPQIRYSNQLNLIGAVRTALLLLGEKFTERELYTAIAGISYMGDPRMSFATENPHKVKNIVGNQLTNFRQLYNPFVGTLPNVTYCDPRCSREDWIHDAATDARMTQDMDPVKRGNMVRRLPKAFRDRLYLQYQKKFQIPGRDFARMLEESKDEDESSFKRRQGGEFDRRIAQEPDIRQQVAEAIRLTVKWPSYSQTVKGLFTAGPTRSWKYLGEKWEKKREGDKMGPSDTSS
ncbi:mitochondrial matrix Mmp37-domain-containing protein [Lineolata rhizophorae]|uniref:Phosphatidate cytidylyltransferase, mitochondrial n=1 Tax=Lineolata rhizophorae TaxID=578093 RepID=A0A6A6P423_9PEZI|nr:mitochondrial matrix Mmp37-domain-containing protein [Lineolata rhizophorae]